MPAAYRDSVKIVATSGDRTTIEVDPAADDGGLTYSAGDVLLLAVMGYTSIGAPSGSDLTWTEILSDTQSGPFGNTAAMKVFRAVADASISSFTMSHGVNDQYGFCLMSIQDADTATPLDGTPQITSGLYTGSSNATGLSVTTTEDDSLLVGCVGLWRSSDVANSFDWSASGMTEREDWEAWDAYTVATQALSAAGATGTRAVAESPEGATSTDAWIFATVAVKSAASGASHTVTVDDSAGQTDQISALAERPVVWSYGVNIGG